MHPFHHEIGVFAPLSPPLLLLSLLASGIGRIAFHGFRITFQVSQLRLHTLAQHWFHCFLIELLRRLLLVGRCVRPVANADPDILRHFCATRYERGSACSPIPLVGIDKKRHAVSSLAPGNQLNKYHSTDFYCIDGCVVHAKTCPQWLIDGPALYECSCNASVPEQRWWWSFRSVCLLAYNCLVRLFFWLGSVNLLLFPKIMAPSTLEQKHKFVEAAR